MHEDNILIIRSLYTAFRTGDFEAFAALCDPQLEWIQNEGFPYGDHHHGAEAVVDGVFKKLALEWENFGFDIDELFATRDRCVAIGAYRGTHRKTERAFRAATVHVFDIDEGKVRRFRQYSDTALVQAATPNRDWKTPAI